MGSYGNYNREVDWDLSDEESEYEETESETEDNSSSDSDYKEKRRKRRKRESSPPIQWRDPKEILEELCSEYRFVVNYGYFEPNFEWMPYELLIKIFENLDARDILRAGLVCRRWCEASQYYKLNRKFQLHFDFCTFTDNSYPINRFLKCSRFFPNFKFSNVKFVPKNDLFWSLYGDVVESISLDACSIKKDDFFRILRKIPYIKSLTLTRCDELFKSWNLVKKVKQTSVCLEHLREFSIQETSLLSKVILDFLFLSAPNINSIDISNCLENTTPRDRILLLDTLLHHLKINARNIKALNLVNIPIDDLFLEGLAGIESLELRELRLTFNGTIGTDNKSGLILLLRSQPKLEILDFSESRGLTNLCLMEICKSMKFLKELILNKCWMINDAGVKEVSRLDHLEVLNISSCDRVTDRGLLEGLLPKDKTSFKVKELHLAVLPYVSEVSIYKLSQKLKELEVLDLSGSSNSITDETLRSIFEFQTKLKYLNLDCCGKITDLGVSGMTERNQVVTLHTIDSLKHLEFVNFGGCYQISDKSLMRRFHLEKLREIGLARCHNVTQSGLHSLSKKCFYIDSIDLSECCHVTDSCIELVTTEIPQLVTLKINGCSQVTDRTLYIINESGKHIKNLYMRRCTRIVENPTKVLKSVRYIYN